MPLTVTGTQNAASDTWAGQALRHAGSLEDQFMKILVTQLKYRDPMEPMDERDFFAQMAQFSSAAQMQSLNDNISWLCSYLIDSHLGKSLLEAATLIGKHFEAVVPDGTAAGVIEGVGFSSGRLVVLSGGREFPVDSLIWIGGAADESE